jgi:hypothetical protein
MPRIIKRTNYEVYKPGEYEVKLKLKMEEEEHLKKQQNTSQNNSQNNFFKTNNNNNDPFKDFDKIFNQPFFKNNMNTNTHTQTTNSIPGMPNLNEIFKNIPFFNNNMGGNMNFTTNTTTNDVPNTNNSSTTYRRRNRQNN